jgi:perosamine synthetase
LPNHETHTQASSTPIYEFEEKFARYVGVKHAIAVSSGTAGLMAAMMALQLEPGDNVVTTPLTHISTPNAVLSAGGIPLFADVNKRTFCLDSEKAVEAMDERTRGVIGVHLYGLPFDVSALEEVRREKGIRVVEDAAHALGASRHGKKVGSIGDMAVFSFYETKHIRLGEGGMITTDDHELAERCRMVSSHGQSGKYNHTALGYNFRLAQSIAEAALKQLVNIDAEVNRRRRLARVYTEELQEIAWISPQNVDSNVEHSYYMFPVLIEGIAPKKIDDLARLVSLEASCPVSRGYGMLSYQQPFYQNIQKLFWGAKLMKFPDYSRYDLHSAQHVVERVVELPTTDSVDEEKAVQISEYLVKGFRRASSS